MTTIAEAKKVLTWTEAMNVGSAAYKTGFSVENPISGAKTVRQFYAPKDIREAAEASHVPGAIEFVKAVLGILGNQCRGLSCQAAPEIDGGTVSRTYQYTAYADLTGATTAALVAAGYEIVPDMSTLGAKFVRDGDGHSISVRMV